MVMLNLDHAKRHIHLDDERRAVHCRGRQCLSVRCWPRVPSKWAYGTIQAMLKL
jgi:hypothetical protein